MKGLEVFLIFPKFGECLSLFSHKVDRLYTTFCNINVWYDNSLFDITEKYIVIAKYLNKYMIYVWILHKEYIGCSLSCSHQGE